MANGHIADCGSDGWRVHVWPHADQEVAVYHSEPFRLAWFATQLVTFVFVIHRTPDSYQSVLDDYGALRRFAGSQKQTLLPFAFQCGFSMRKSCSN